MSGYVRFSMDENKIGSSVVVLERRVISIPGGAHYFRVIFHNHFDLILKSEKPEKLDGRWVKQVVYVFDKRFAFTYNGVFDVFFDVFSLGREHVTLGMYTSNERLGSLKIDKESIRYKGEVVTDRACRAGYGKAVMLRG